MKENTIPVTVKILEKEYRVACEPAHKDSLIQSATLLNKKMHEIRISGKVVGSDRIAVMAALNLAHELLQQQHVSRENNQLTQNIKHIREKIDQVVYDNKHLEMS
jgi:cell division protein ZapA